MVGRKPKSYNYGLEIIVDVPLYVVKYLPIIPKGARRTYRQGKKIVRLTNMRISQGVVTEDNFPKYKAYLEKLGYTKITAEQMTTRLPLHCPKCDKTDGHPIFQPYRKVRSARYSDFRIYPKKWKMYYNHSKPKYHQCFIGYWNSSGSMQLSKKIEDIRKINPFYHLEEGESIEFEIPKKRKKSRKKLS